MARRKLHISAELSLPLDAVTQTFAILAVRGAGKSNAGVVMAEEMYKAKLPFVVIDAKGDWWGIRASADTKGSGLDVPIFGAPSRRRNKPPPDLPLDESSGELLADLVVDERLPCVLDIQGFSEAAKVRFLLAFGSRLFDRNEEPLHVFFEEADDYVPQNLRGRENHAKLVNVMGKLLKQGRTFGIGGTVISQRSAVVNKDVLTQCETLMALRTTAALDRDAISDWVKTKSGGHLDIVESLPSLADGEAWVWSPAFLKTVKKIRFRRRETFDSGATPKVGKTRPRITLADVDVGALEQRMTETVERAKETDPTELKRARARERAEFEKQRKSLTARISELERDVESRPPETIEVPMLDEETRLMLKTLSDELLRVDRSIVENITEATQEAARRLDRILESRELAAPAKQARAKEPTRDVRSAVRAKASRAAERGVPAPDEEGRGGSRPPSPAAPPSQDGELHLKAGARRILETLARYHPTHLTRSQLGTLARFKITGGTFQTYYSTLKRHGLIEEDSAGISISEDGFAYIGEVPTEPHTPEEVLEMWRGALKAGARAMLDVLVQEYPEGLTKEELAERVEMTVSGGTFQTYLSTLRRNGLAEIRDGEVSASETLFMVGA